MTLRTTTRTCLEQSLVFIKTLTVKQAQSWIHLKRTLMDMEYPKELLLTQDEFYVKELQAPSGYAKLDTVWKVTTVENAVCALLEVPNILEENTNDLVQVKVKKVESGTEKPLAGAYFTVYKDQGLHTAGCGSWPDKYKW